MQKMACVGRSHGVLKCFYSSVVTAVRSNCHRASISRTNRNLYSEPYIVSLVFPDGSSTSIRYKEPRSLIQLPIDLSKLTDEEKQELLMKRKSKEFKVMEDDIEDSFDPSQYSYLWK